MNILITGASGFLGVNACKWFLERGHKVIGVDNFYTGTQRNVEQLRSFENFSFIERDVRDSWDVFPSVDIVINLACPASPVHYQKDPIFTWSTSVVGILNAVNYCKENKARLVFSSTSEIYGDPLVPLQSESYWGNVNPIGIRACYDEGKRAAESLLFDAKRFLNLDVRVARIFNTYGPGMAPDDGRVVSNLIIQAIKNQPLTLFGNGTQTRSFCFVADTISALGSLTLTNNELDTPINIGNPDEITMLTLADTILDLCESKSEITFFDLPSDDPKIRRPDISLARHHLHWDPLVNLRSGLFETVNYFKKII
jgi:UDP-glucuronate decarboxylase